MAAPISSTQVLGGRLLREIGSEEGSLEDLLKTLRTSLSPNSPQTGISSLDALWAQHGATTNLNLTGRSRPLLHLLLTTLLSPPHSKAITLIDLTHRFSPSHLNTSLDELKHLYIFQPTESNFKATLESVEEFMLYGDGSKGSRGREWWGTIVIGGTGGKINAGWRGWMRIDREETADFGWGVSVEEALGTRQQRREVLESRGWKGVVERDGGRGGEFHFK